MLLGLCPCSTTLICRFVLENVHFSTTHFYNKFNPCTDQDGFVLQNIWDQFLAELSTFLSRSCNFSCTNQDNAFFLHSFVCFLYLECRKTVCLCHMGQKHSEQESFLRSSSRMLSAVDNKSVEAIYRVRNKNLGFQKGDVNTG